MLHATDAHLRRLEDEPLAVPDRIAEHLDRCARCRDRLAGLMSDAQRCAGLLGGPQPVADLDAAWARFERERGRVGSDDAPSRRAALSFPRRSRRRLAGIPLRRGLAAGAIAVVLAGTATAATLATVLAPTHVAPVALSDSDISALADFMGLGPSLADGGGQGGARDELGGFPTASGSLALSFGTIRWSSSGSGGVVPTLADAEREAGFAVALPSQLPDGVAGPVQFVVQPRVEVTVTLDPSVANIGGSSIVLDAGPAVLAAYGSVGGSDLPTLGILTMPRPSAVASGATISQIEAFVLGQPAFPADLAQELRLLGDLGTTLPVPVPAGADERSVEVGGAPGVLVADPSNVASGVVWEDSAGTLRAVAGLLDQHDLLDVADQLA